MNDEVCDSYFGNVCSGFGGKTICNFCGHDMYKHEPYKSEAEAILKDFPELGDNNV
jgi:hypothetical protein